MANPKVFVSSTCFDLSEIREQLKRFIESFGFDAVLSENGEVFYHPDIHTHEACLYEILNCHLFVLIIGGRFGGEYVADRTKSITNAEYEAAKKNNIPIFTYVRENVLLNHQIYLQNKRKNFVSDIDYPAIEKQEYALDIFNFIDDVRRSPTNNAVEGFKNFQGIETHLRKQWAGMFFDFLRTREVKSQIDATNHLLSGLSSSSDKLEELIKSLYRSVDHSVADENIKHVEIINTAERFLSLVLRPSFVDEDEYHVDQEKFNPLELSKLSPEGLSWHCYLVKLGLFRYDDYPVWSGDKCEEIDDWEEGVASDFTAEKGRCFLLSLNDANAEKLYETGMLKTTEAQRQIVFGKALNKFSQGATNKGIAQKVSPIRSSGAEVRAEVSPII